MNRLPAEWEPQRAVMLTWPREDGDFADNHTAVEACFAGIARAIAPHADLLVSFASASQRDRIVPQLQPHYGEHRLSSFVAPNDDVWARDHGPIGVASGNGTTLLNFHFDGWGGKHPAARDDQLSRSLFAQRAFGDLPMQDVELTLEGGALETDGAGTLMATASSVLDPLRNPGKTQADIEHSLGELFGTDRYFWLQHGALIGDDTDGHIDTLARFAGADCIVFQASGGTIDPNHAELDAMHQELLALRQRDGQPYRLFPLPWAGEHRDDEGQLLPASYANFLILNGAILLPVYRVTADEDAMQVLRTAYPDHAVIPVDCSALIRQYGSLHCVTMNIPA